MARHAQTADARACPICGTVFRPRLEQLARGRGVYCSRPCWWVARRTRETRPCLRCGAPLIALPGQVKRGHDKYCSQACAHASQSRPLAERVQEKTAQGPDCWRWIGYIAKTGYGMIGVNGRAVYAHRVAYELEFGPIPIGMDLHHVCRNRWCVNPAHLVPVTRLAHRRRHMSPEPPGPRPRRYPLRGRAVGERHHRAKLTADDVRAIRARYAAGERTQVQLAAEYGVRQTTISMIILRRVWTHLD